MPDIPGEVPRLDLIVVLPALAEGVSIADVDGRVVFSNAKASHILGTEDAAVSPMSWADHYGVLVPGTDQPFPKDRYPLVRARQVTVSASARPFRDQKGDITGAVVIFRDITKLRRAQEALEQTNRELTDTQKLKDELNAFVAHDLKNPLTTVMALVELALGEDELDPEAVRADLAEIGAAARRMHRMVMDLLDVQLAEDGSLKLDRERVSVRELADEVRATVRPRAPGIVVEEIDEDLLLSADRSLLFRVLTNLVDNCVKYGPASGRIAISGGAADGGWVRICVQDEGPGVPDELRERIFDKYAQVERTEGTRATDSRGLGLRFCRVVIEAHGGRIWVEDAEPKGARFSVGLPVLDPT